MQNTCLNIVYVYYLSKSLTKFQKIAAGLSGLSKPAIFALNKFTKFTAMESFYLIDIKKF